MIHLSDIKKFNRCDKYYWYATHYEMPFIPFFICNENIIELAKKYFHIESYYEGRRGDDALKALNQWNEHEVFINARFAYRDLRVTIPILFKKDKVTMVMTYNQCFPKLHEEEKIASMITVLKKNGIQVDEVKILHVNANYVREDELNVDECLMLSDHLYNDKNKPVFPVEEHVFKEVDLDTVLDQIHALPEDMSSVVKKRTSVCTSHSKCEFYDRCFPEFQHPTSVLNLSQSQKKYELLDQGITDMAMVNEGIEGNRQQYAQIMAAKKQGLFVDYPALKVWMDDLQYPLTYLDFEWETNVYPPYKGMKPYDALCFQYSMHIQKEKGGKCFHEQYLGKGDCRREFIEELLRVIPKTGNIIVFNMQGAEALRLQQLAQVFPEYADQLEQVWTRMIDLALPFSIGVVYDQRMAGEYNLKKLLSLFSDLSYDDLKISQGLQAVKSYRELANHDDEAIKQALYEYCGMDTYSMVVLIEFLYKQLEKR